MTNWLPDLTTGSGPLYQRIADSIESDIDRGVIAAGEKLPPQRDLAYDIGTTVGTIGRAYQSAARARPGERRGRPRNLCAGPAIGSGRPRRIRRAAPCRHALCRCAARQAALRQHGRARYRPGHHCRRHAVATRCRTIRTRSPATPAIFRSAGSRPAAAGFAQCRSARRPTASSRRSAPMPLSWRRSRR